MRFPNIMKPGSQLWLVSKVMPQMGNVEHALDSTVLILVINLGLEYGE